MAKRPSNIQVQVTCLLTIDALYPVVYIITYYVLDIDVLDSTCTGMTSRSASRLRATCRTQEIHSVPYRQLDYCNTCSIHSTTDGYSYYEHTGSVCMQDVRE